jgi:peptide/nickel transport system substrate-binding protein
VYDPAGAAALLDTAGWANDGQGGRVRDTIPLRFTLAYAADNPENTAVAEGVQAGWRRVGVEVALQSVDRDRLLRDYLVPRQFEAVLLGWQGVANDPDVYQLWHSTQARAPGFNFAGWRNDRADQDLEQARQTVKRADRAALYADFQQVFADEVPGLLLYYPRYTYAVRARVQGVTLPRALADPSSRFQSLPGWYIQTAPQVGR